MCVSILTSELPGDGYEMIAETCQSKMMSSNKTIAVLLPSTALYFMKTQKDKENINWYDKKLYFTFGLLSR